MVIFNCPFSVIFYGYLICLCLQVFKIHSSTSSVMGKNRISLSFTVFFSFQKLLKYETKKFSVKVSTLFYTQY
jgi:hypothetical protein